MVVHSQFELPLFMGTVWCVGFDLFKSTIKTPLSYYISIFCLVASTKTKGELSNSLSPFLTWHKTLEDSMEQNRKKTKDKAT